MEPIEAVIALAQKCLERCPAIVLGSGASAAFGIRGMGPLQQHLLEHIHPSTEHATVWNGFKQDLQRTNDLEATLQNIQLPPALLADVVHETRSLILSDDLRVFSCVAVNSVTLPVTTLLRHLFRSTHTRVSIVTTNYDRLAEYAADAAHVTHYTGFTSGYRRHLCSRIRGASRVPRDRTVEIWKVHGSVDWFVAVDGNPVGLPYELTYPDQFQPLLVAPGITKFQITHQEPFRTIIACADDSLMSARSFLCVGYGFNDSHIEPKLVERVQQNMVPIVILARTLRATTKTFLTRCAQAPFLALEEAGSDTRAYYPDAPGGIIIANSALWDFPKFLDAILKTT